MQNNMTNNDENGHETLTVLVKAALKVKGFFSLKEKKTTLVPQLFLVLCLVSILAASATAAEGRYEE